METEHIEKILSLLTAEEKIRLCGVPATFVSRFVDSLKIEKLNFGAENFLQKESMCACACTFDKEIFFNLGKGAAKKNSRDEYIFSSRIGLSVIRNPFDKSSAYSLSEEPLVISGLYESFIDGAGGDVSGADILGGGFIERSIDARALFEIYLKPFLLLGKKLDAAEIPGGLLNGVPLSEDEEFIKILKDNIKENALIFNGMMTVFDKVKSIKSGGGYEFCDNYNSEKAVKDALKDGRITMAEIDNFLKQILIFTFNYTDKTAGGKNKINTLRFDSEKNIAEKSVVLLKNENILPLKNPTKTVYFCGEGYEEYKAQFSHLKELAVVEDIRQSDAVFLFCKNENNRISKAAAKVLEKIDCSVEKVILVILSDTPVEIETDNDFYAVFFVPYSKKDVYCAFKDIALGNIEPTGKLPFTWAKKEADYPMFLNPRLKDKDMFCYESTLCGCRYFDVYSDKKQYCFGHGLSYSDLKINPLKLAEESAGVSVDFAVQNDSDAPCERVIFVFDSLIDKPVFGLRKRLAGFTRVSVPANSMLPVHLLIKKDALTAYNVKNNRFEIAGGKYVFEVGFSADDIVRTARIKLTGEDKFFTAFDVKNTPSYFDERTFCPSGIDIERATGLKLFSPPHKYSHYLKPQFFQGNKLVLKAEKALKKVSKANVNIDLGAFPKEALERIISGK